MTSFVNNPLSDLFLEASGGVVRVFLEKPNEVWDGAVLAEAMPLGRAGVVPVEVFDDPFRLFDGGV